MNKAKQKRVNAKVINDAPSTMPKRAMVIRARRAKLTCKVKVAPYDHKHPTRLEPWTIDQIADNFREDSKGQTKEKKIYLRTEAREKMRQLRNTASRTFTPGELSILTAWDL